MIFPAPTAVEERATLLHERVRALRKCGAITAEEAAPMLARWSTPWRSQGPLLTAVFFFLTCIGISAFAGLSAMFVDRGYGSVTMIACIVAAELMIRRAKVFGSGVEMALISGGLVAFITSLPSEGKPEALLVFALAAAITSWRTHSAIFGTACVLLVYAYAVVRIDREILLVAACGGIVLVICVVALLREWSRPWIERLFAGIALTIVPATYVGTKLWWWSTIEIANLRLAAAFAVAGVTLIVLGLLRRHHAVLIAGMLSAAFAVIEVWLVIALNADMKLLATGFFLLGGSLAVGRLLRWRTTGLVATPLSITPVDDSLLAAAGAVMSGAAAPSSSAAPASAAPVGGGGQMGGAGATGEW